MARPFNRARTERQWGDPGPEFVAYVDEAGDQGFSTSSSAWFVISAVVLKSRDDLMGTVDVLKEVRKELNKADEKTLHFREMNHQQRLLYVDRISKAPLKTLSLLVHKLALNSEGLQEGHALYCTGLMILLDRVARFCRAQPPDPSAPVRRAKLVISTLGSLSQAKLNASIASPLAVPGLKAPGLDSTIIEPSEIHLRPTGQRAGLQIADAVASSILQAVQPSQYGFAEPRYLQMLRGVLHRHATAGYEGYGLSFEPTTSCNEVRGRGFLDGV